MMDVKEFQIVVVAKPIERETEERSVRGTEEDFATYGEKKKT